jgi:aryl-alcohol dehydrogenase
MLIKAAVTYEKDGAFLIKELELEEPRAHDVLVKISACGVCHTDALARGQLLPAPLPIVLGHEGSGIVEKVGSAVKTIRPGDHVVMTQNSCGVCEPCRSGHSAVCIHVGDYNFSGTYPDGDTRLTDADGVKIGSFFSQSSFATYAIADEENTIKISDDMDLLLAGPLGCGIQTGAGAVLNVLKPDAATSIAVFGCGGVGLSAVMAAKVAGCTEIIAVDAVDSRLELARELGATYTINGKVSPDIGAEIIAYTKGGIHYSVDSTGNQALVTAAVASLRNRGKAAIIGTGAEISIPTRALNGGKSVIGVTEGDSVPQIFIPKLVDLYQKGWFPFDKLVKFYDFEEINQAFEDSAKGITVKPILRF